MLTFKPRPETGGLLLDDLESDLGGGSYAGTSTVNLGSASSYSGTLSGGAGLGASGFGGGGYTGGYASSGASSGGGGPSTGQDVANVLSSLFSAAGAIIPAVSGSAQAAARAEQAKLSQILAAGGSMGQFGGMAPPPSPPSSGMSTGLKVGLGVGALAGLYWLTRER